MDIEKLYKCFNCDWIGTENEMDCDSIEADWENDESPEDIFVEQYVQNVTDGIH